MYICVISHKVSRQTLHVGTKSGMLSHPQAVVCRTRLQQILDSLIVDLQVGHLGAVAGTLLLALSHAIEQRLADARDQALTFLQNNTVQLGLCV